MGINYDNEPAAQDFNRERRRRSRRLNTVAKNAELIGETTEYEKRQISKEFYAKKKEKFKQMCEEDTILYSNYQEIGSVKLGPRLDLKIRAVAYAGGKFIELVKEIKTIDYATGEITRRYQPKQGKITIPVKYPRYFAEPECYERVSELLIKAIETAVIMPEVDTIVAVKNKKKEESSDDSNK